MYDACSPMEIFIEDRPSEWHPEFIKDEKRYFLIRKGLRCNFSCERSKEMVKTNCHNCEHKRKVPGNYHIDSEYPGNYIISCAKPSHEINSDPRVIGRGWFIYPLFFDPDLMTNGCENYSPTGESEAMNILRVLMRSHLRISKRNKLQSPITESFDSYPGDSML